MVSFDGGRITITFDRDQAATYYLNNGYRHVGIELPFSTLRSLLLLSRALANGALPDLLPRFTLLPLSRDQQASLRNMTGVDAHLLPLPRTRLTDFRYREVWPDGPPPIRIGRSFSIVTPAATAASDPSLHRIVLDPTAFTGGPVFGTGHHETTQLALVMMERSLVPGSTVLDVGTGSGILAIAAARLGAKRVVALDIEPACIEAARRNALLNQVEDRVSPVLGSPDSVSGTSFDLIVINLPSPVVVNLAPTLSSLLAPTAVLLVCGLDEIWLPRVKAALATHALALTAEHRIGDWLGLMLFAPPR
jgi:ribosomal protein L11 methyltransferase